MIGRSTVLLVWLIVTPTAMSSQDLFSAAVARILKVKGRVTIEDQQGKKRVADLYGVVREHEQLVLKPGTEITLGFRVDGHMERVATACRAKVDKEKIVAPVKVERIEPPRRHRRLVASAVRQLGPLSREGTRLLKGAQGEPPTGESTGDTPTAAGLEPIHQSTIVSTLPKFTWPPVADAIAYDVTLSQADGAEIWKATTRENTLEWPGGRQLRDGQQYVWEVTVRPEQGTSRQAFRGEFTVSTDPQRTEVRQIAQLADDAPVEYLVLAAAWYERNGFLEEAIAEHRRVAQLSPQSASVLLTLASLYDRAGRGQAAQTARTQADAILSERAGPPRVRSIFGD